MSESIHNFLWINSRVFAHTPHIFCPPLWPQRPAVPTTELVAHTGGSQTPRGRPGEGGLRTTSPRVEAASASTGNFRTKATLALSGRAAEASPHVPFTKQVHFLHSCVPPREHGDAGFHVHLWVRIWQSWPYFYGRIQYTAQRVNGHGIHS